MNTTGKIQNKGQVTIPTAVRRQAGLSKGDLVNFAFKRGQIVITPTLIIDRSKFPTTDDEYTPAQRRVIDARLAEGEKGPFYGPFKNGDEIAAFMKKRRRDGQARQIKTFWMNVHLSQRAVEQLASAPLPVQKAFIKQINFLVRDLKHPSLHAKKYDESENSSQARVNDDWRFYLNIPGETYTQLIPHPK